MPEMTIVMAEGRRMMRLSRELTPERFNALLAEYQRLLGTVFERMGGRDMHVASDTVTAVFTTPKEATLAAVAAQRAVAAHEWPSGVKPAISVGVDSTALRCAELCDAAEGGEIYVSPTTAELLAREDLGDVELRDLGEQQTRRTRRAVHAYELVVP